MVVEAKFFRDLEAAKTAGAVARVESLLDEAIKNGTPCVNLEYSTPEDVLTTIKKMYHRAGWSVDIQKSCDQKDNPAGTCFIYLSLPDPDEQ